MYVGPLFFFHLTLIFFKTFSFHIFREQGFELISMSILSIRHNQILENAFKGSHIRWEPKPRDLVNIFQNPVLTFQLQCPPMIV